jgi:hypothetical protein
MTTMTPSTALATVQPGFTDAERLALAGFLAGYRGLTREACTLDFQQFTSWCRARSLPSGVPGGTTSRTPPPLTATSSGRSSPPPAEHALISLLALNGLRVSEATGADIEHMGTERGHRPGHRRAHRGPLHLQ